MSGINVAKFDLRRGFDVLLGLLSFGILVSVLAPRINQLSYREILPAMFLYVLAHFVRLARLMVLSIDNPRAVYWVVPAHLLSAPLGFFLPFKLGEIFRLTALALSFDTYKQGLLLWGFERIGDVLVLIIAAVLLCVSGGSVSPGPGALIIILAAVSGAGLLIAWAGFNLSSLAIEVLVFKSRSRLGFKALKQIWEFQNMTVRFLRRLNGRWLALFVSSLLIWAFEFAAFWCAWRSSGHDGPWFTFQAEILNANSVTSNLYERSAEVGQISMLVLGILALLVAWRRSSLKDSKW